MTLEYHTDDAFDGLFEAEPFLPSTSAVGTTEIDVARTGGTTVRKSVYEDVGPFDERFDNLGDIDYWVRLLQDYCVVGITEPLYKYHQHGEQMTKDADGAMRGLSLLLSKHERALTRDAIANYRCNLAELAARNGDLSRAGAELRAAIEADPRRAAQYGYELGIRLSPRQRDLEADLSRLRSRVRATVT